MKKIMNAAATAICLFAMAWTAVSCSSDDNHQNSADQMLKNMLGSYEGTLGFSYSTSTVSGWTTSWKVDEMRIITIDKFPYRTLANGVSRMDRQGQSHRFMLPCSRHRTLRSRSSLKGSDCLTATLLSPSYRKSSST